MNSYDKDIVKKRVLYIGTPFFGYYAHIINELELLGYKVDYYNDRPSENAFIKGMCKINRNFIGPVIDKYFEKIYKKSMNIQYDVVLIVNCKVFTVEMINKLKNSQKSAKFILYLWDALVLYPHAKDLIPLFDKAYSFDLEDCKKIDGLELHPLFFCKTFEDVGREVIPYSSREYDILSVCTVHPNRYIILSRLLPFLKKKGIKVYSYMFINKLQYFYNKVFVKKFKNTKMNEFQFKSLPENEMLQILRNTRAVFDIQHNKQSGLTMRTIETLGARRKLITYNASIRNYDFYTEDNILVLNDNNWGAISGFVEKEYVPIDEEVYKNYSLSNWLKKMIES